MYINIFKIKQYFPGDSIFCYKIQSHNSRTANL